jgi:hypothetical protein
MKNACTARRIRIFGKNAEKKQNSKFYQKFAMTENMHLQILDVKCM